MKLEQTAPGHYEGTFKASEVGTYLPIVNYREPEGALKTYTTAVTVPFSPEYRALATNDLLLKEIADLTGGKVINQETDVFRRDFPPEASYTDIWQWLLAAAVVLFLVDVFVRRVMVDWTAVAERIRDAFWWVPGPRRPRPPAREQVALYLGASLRQEGRPQRERKEAAAKKFAPDAAASAETLEEHLARARPLRARRAAAEKSGSGAPPPSEVAKDPPARHIPRGFLRPSAEPAPTRRRKVTSKAAPVPPHGMIFGNFAPSRRRTCGRGSPGLAARCIRRRNR